MDTCIVDPNLSRTIGGKYRHISANRIGGWRTCFSGNPMHFSF